MSSARISRPSLDDMYLHVLPVYASRGTCMRRRVACLITNEAGVLLGAGYNGPPKGFAHCTDAHPCAGSQDCPGDTANCEAVHAEQNAILQCGGRINEAFTVYCSCTPCFTCAKMIANTGVKRVVVDEPYADKRGEVILRRAGISIIIAKPF